MPHPPHDCPAAGSPLSHRILFVILTFLSFGVFAPTIVFPVLRQYGALRAEEDRLTRRVTDLERQLHQRALLKEQFAHDVVINERLAIIDLNYVKPGEEIYPVLRSETPLSSPAQSPVSSSDGITIPSTWPTWAHRGHDWLDEKGLVHPFLDRGLRPMLLLMSGGLLVAAFLLFAPTARGRDRGQPTQEPVAPASSPPDRFRRSDAAVLDSTG